MDILQELKSNFDNASKELEANPTTENLVNLSRCSALYLEAIAQFTSNQIVKTLKTHSGQDSIHSMLNQTTENITPWWLITVSGSTDATRLMRHLKNDFEYKFIRKENTYNIIKKRPKIEWEDYSFKEKGKLPKGHMRHHEIPQWVGACCDIIRYKYKSPRTRKQMLAKLKKMITIHLSPKGKRLLRKLTPDGSIIRSKQNIKIVNKMEHAVIHRGKRIPSAWAFIDML